MIYFSIYKRSIIHSFKSVYILINCVNFMNIKVETRKRIQMFVLEISVSMFLRYYPPLRQARARFSSLNTIRAGTRWTERIVLKFVEISPVPRGPSRRSIIINRS